MNLTPLVLIIILAISAASADEFLSTDNVNHNLLPSLNSADKAQITSDDVGHVDSEVMESNKDQREDDGDDASERDKEEEVMDGKRLAELYDQTSDDDVNESEEVAEQEHNQVWT